MTPTRPVARIAHRGNSYASLENTLDAFARAMKIGCDWLELDVRTTRGGTSGTGGARTEVASP